MRRAVVLALFLVLAACGSDGDDTAATNDFIVAEQVPDPAPAPSADAADEPAADDTTDDAADGATDDAADGATDDAADGSADGTGDDGAGDAADDGAGDAAGDASGDLVPGIVGWDQVRDECVADGESPEACDCLIDLMQRSSEFEDLGSADVDAIMQGVFEEFFEEAMACFEGG